MRAIDVSSMATGGDGTSRGTAWTGWDTAINWAAGQQYNFPAGWYCYATSPNFSQDDIALVGEAGTRLLHTGTGDAVSFDNPTGWTWGLRMENFYIFGNASTRHGVFVRGVRNANFRNLVVGDVSDTAYRFEAAVSGHLDSLVVADAAAPTRPLHALWVGARSTNSAHGSTGLVFTNFIGEVTTGDYTAFIQSGSDGHTFVRGTMEGNAGKGLVIASIHNRVDGMWFEQNGGADLILQGQSNTIENVISTRELRLEAGAQNRIIGGRYANIYIHPYVHMSLFEGMEWTGTFSDNDDLGSTIKLGNIAPGSQGGYQLSASIGNIIPFSLALPGANTVVNTDVSKASSFNFFAFANFVLENPTKPVDGLRVTWRIGQDNTGGRVISFGSKFRPNPGQGFPVLSTAPKSFDYITATYNKFRDTWDIQ